MVGDEAVEINRTRPLTRFFNKKNPRFLPMNTWWKCWQCTSKSLGDSSQIVKPQQFKLNVESNFLLHSKLDSKSRSILLILNTPTSQVRAQSQISLTTVKGKLFDRRQVQENVEQKTGQFYQVHRFPSAGGRYLEDFGWVTIKTYLIIPLGSVIFL